MKSRRFQILIEYIARKYPHFRAGIEEAVDKSPTRFEKISEMYLGWVDDARGREAIERSVDAFVQFTTEVNLAQARYETTGRYEHQSFDEVYRKHYGRDDRMQGYLWGIYFTNFLWAHHLELCMFYEDRFLTRLSATSEIVEIAPGHGGWGVWALHELPGATLAGFDISPSSIEIASALSRAAGVGGRARYLEQNALGLMKMPGGRFDAAICCFLIEHLEEPGRLFDVIHHVLRPGGLAFLTGALTAAQVDHIYEFHRESELVVMAEKSTLRVRETLSANPNRLLPRARFVPRSMALVLSRDEVAAGGPATDQTRGQ